MDQIQYRKRDAIVLKSFHNQKSVMFRREKLHIVIVTFLYRTSLQFTCNIC